MHQTFIFQRDSPLLNQKPRCHVGCRSTHTPSLVVFKLNRFRDCHLPSHLLIQIIWGDKPRARFSLLLNRHPNVSDSDGFILQSSDASLRQYACKTRHATVILRGKKCKHRVQGFRKYTMKMCFSALYIKYSVPSWEDLVHFVLPRGLTAALPSPIASQTIKYIMHTQMTSHPISHGW